MYNEVEDDSIVSATAAITVKEQTPASVPGVGFTAVTSMKGAPSSCTYYMVEVFFLSRPIPSSDCEEVADPSQAVVIAEDCIPSNNQPMAKTVLVVTS